MASQSDRIIAISPAWSRKRASSHTLSPLPTFEDRLSNMETNNSTAKQAYFRSGSPTKLNKISCVCGLTDGFADLPFCLRGFLCLRRPYLESSSSIILSKWDHRKQYNDTTAPKFDMQLQSGVRRPRTINDSGQKQRAALLTRNGMDGDCVFWFWGMFFGGYFHCYLCDLGL